MKRATWDKWAPVSYMFLIGLALGLAIGFAVGLVYGSSGILFILFAPAIIIVAAFIILSIISQRVDRNERS